MNIALRDLADLDELKRRIRKESDAKQRDRWRAVLMAIQGSTTAEIMATLGRSKNFVQRWNYFYRDHGLQRVRPIKQTGKPPTLPREQHQALRQRIDSDEQTLRGLDIVELLQKEFGATYSLNGAYDLLHRLGYEPLKPRPVNPKKTPEAQQAWKQHAPLLSSPCETPSPRRRSTSGSRMNVDSDKKDA